MKMFRKKSNKSSTKEERDPLLSKTQQKGPTSVKYMRGIKENFVQPLHVLKSLNKPPVHSNDTKYRKLIDKNKFLEACEFISKMNSTDKEALPLYNDVAQEMWKTTTLALSGDVKLHSQMNAVAACVNWAKTQEFNEELHQSPKMWDKELKKLITNHIEKEHLATCVYNKGKMSLKHYLKELETKSLQTIEVHRSLLGDLFTIYLKSLIDCIHHHLSSLVLNDFTYEEWVQLYIWGYEECKRVRIYHQELEDFDPYIYEQWFKDTGEKLITVGKDTVKKELREILEKEIGWNTYPEPKHDYYFYNILKEITSVTKAVEPVSTTLVSKLETECWNEVHYFVTRYDSFIQKKINESSLGNKVFVALRIVKNCQILRNTIENIGMVPENKINLNTEMKNCIGCCEAKGLKLSCATLKSKLKETFQNHFTKNCSEFETVLEHLQRSLKKADIPNNKMHLKTIHHTAVTLYIQYFFVYPKTVGNFLAGSKKLQETFESLVSDKNLLDNPLEYMSYILTGKDVESTKTTVMCFSRSHPDMRKEHLKALMDLNGNLNSKDRAYLLNCFKQEQADMNEENMCFFKDIKMNMFGGALRYLCCSG
ncbi:hypothetical protein XENTR_v10021765 [Xenopus tropicalis]|uniref:Uncharacterized protein LOC105948196 n=1 Tax=Xenopus tropicalis TaxID=8364 RepID=A0A8J0T319_XENTR|nr:uncharacterized protein LOC105948196 [Xenopus tropicalis]KAE8586786.1 hypothetical protein XENTR_v10021765 [Xenopus tropicalis]